MFYVSALLCTVASLVAIFICRPLICDPRIDHPWPVVALALFLIGLIDGLVARKTSTSRPVRFIIQVLKADIIAVVGWNLVPDLIAGCGATIEKGPLFLWVLIWGGASFVGFSIIGYFKPRPAAARTITEDDAQAFIEAHDLVVAPAELKEMRNSPRGWVCQICYHDSGERWLRCPRVPQEHVFHEGHFREKRWRCPKCHSLLYDP